MQGMTQHYNLHALDFIIFSIIYVITKFKLLIWLCIKWQCIFASILGFFLLHLLFRAWSFFLLPFCKVCFAFHPWAFLKKLFIKCYWSKFDNFICDMFDVIFYHLQNNILVVSIDGESSMLLTHKE
jgi:hypothetical protein